jgi:hypothetical protein
MVNLVDSVAMVIFHSIRHETQIIFYCQNHKILLLFDKLLSANKCPLIVTLLP